MLKNSIKLFSILTFITLICAGTSWAGDWNRYRRGNGELTRQERRELSAQRHQIRRFENYAEADGRISRRERRQMENMRHQLDRDRYHFRHNNDRGYVCGRGCAHPHEHRWHRYHHIPGYRPYGYYYPGHSYYGFSGAWIQPGGFFSISIGGN